MKTISLNLAAMLMVSLLAGSCTREMNRIDGMGIVTTKSLQVDDFSRINIEGVDDLIITYGPVQQVSVTGHPNIISRIETRVSNSTWNIRLEEGNYGIYELTYHVTLPYIDRIVSTGTGDVEMSSAFNLDKLLVALNGSGDFSGFPRVNDCTVLITGSSDCEVYARNSLDVNIEGSGNVYYKGNPVITSSIQGSGAVVGLGL